MVLLAQIYIAIDNFASAENQRVNAQNNKADESKIIHLMLEAYLLQQNKKAINTPIAMVTQELIYCSKYKGV
jgi:hypothetical protein